MQPVIKEREYKGTIDPRQHWLDEIANAPDDETGRKWADYCQAQLNRLEKSNDR